MKKLLMAMLLAAVPMVAQSTDPHPSVRMNWQDADFAANPLMTFNVYKGTGPCGATLTMTLLNTTPVSVLTYLDTAVSVTKQYCYDVTAVLGGVESGASNTINPTIPAANPTNLTGTAK